jgi:hypothetical protein
MEDSNMIQSRQESGAPVDIGSILNGYEGPSQFYMAQMLWAPIGAAIALATLINLADILVSRHRSVEGH